MKNMKKKDGTTRRKVLKRSLMAVPTVMSFTLADLKAQASRPRPFAPK